MHILIWLFHLHDQLSVSHIDMHTIHLNNSCLRVKDTFAQTLAQLHSPNWKQRPRGQTTLPLLRVTQQLLITT